jgi:hypothetical protein
MNFLNRLIARSFEPHFITSTGSKLSLRDFGFSTVRAAAKDAADFVATLVVKSEVGTYLDIVKLIRAQRFAAEVYLTTYSVAAHAWGESRRLDARCMNAVLEGVERGLACIHSPNGDSLNADFLKFLQSEVVSFVAAFEATLKQNKSVASHRMQQVLRSAYSEDAEELRKWAEQMDISVDGFELLLALDQLRDRALARNSNELAVGFSY